MKEMLRGNVIVSYFGKRRVEPPLLRQSKYKLPANLCFAIVVSTESETHGYIHFFYPKIPLILGRNESYCAYFFYIEIFHYKIPCIFQKHRVFRHISALYRNSHFMIIYTSFLRISNSFSFVFSSGFSITISSKELSTTPISFPGSIPAAIKSLPVTAKSFSDTHSFFSKIS